MHGAGQQPGSIEVGELLHSNFTEISHGWFNYTLLKESERHKEREFFKQVDKLNELSQLNVEDCWNVIKLILDMPISEGQLAELASGPFEEVLVTLGDAMPSYFSDLELPMVRRLLPFVCFNSVHKSGYEWAKEVMKDE